VVSKGNSPSIFPYMLFSYSLQRIYATAD
jgi:hypothetical protein